MKRIRYCMHEYESTVLYVYPYVLQCFCRPSICTRVSKILRWGLGTVRCTYPPRAMCMCVCQPMSRLAFRHTYCSSFYVTIAFLGHRPPDLSGARPSRPLAAQFLSVLFVRLFHRLHVVVSCYTCSRPCTAPNKLITMKRIAPM